MKWAGLSEPLKSGAVYPYAHEKQIRQKHYGRVRFKMFHIKM